MFGVIKALGLWAFALSSGSSNKNFAFQNARLKGALEFYQEGQQLLQGGSYQEGCDAIMTGIFSGRKVVEAMQVENDPESADALEWLVSCYISCCEARMKLGDWQTARSDAWAACMFSQSLNPQALQCMLTVCENTDDLFGQLSTLKSIQTLLLLSDDDDDDDDGSSLSETALISLEYVEKRMEAVEALLENTFKT